MQDLSQHEVGSNVVAAYGYLCDKGYLPGTFGNVSCRVPGGLLITPSRVARSELDEASLVFVGIDGQLRPGESRLPSSELGIHLSVYRRRADVGAVVHTHSLYAAAVSSAHETIPIIVEEQAQVLGGSIECTSYVQAGDHSSLGEAGVKALGSSMGALLANHGTLACGRDIAEALLAAEVIERCCHIYCATGAVGKPIAIPEDAARAERDRWLHRYGSSADGAAGAAAATSSSEDSDR